MLLLQGLEDLGDPGRDGLGDDLLEGVLSEDVADDRGCLDHRSLLRRQQVEARREQSLNGGRERQLLEVARGDPGVAFPAHEAVVDEHGQELFRKERVALGGLHDSLPHFRGQRSDQALDHVRALLVRERLERDARPSGLRPPQRPLLVELRAGRANEEDRGLQRLGDPLDQVEERGLPPVNVFEEDDEWFLLGERLEELARAPEKLLDRELLLGEADGGGDALQRIAGAGETGCKLASGDVRRIVLADTRYLANHLGQRPECDAASVGQTTAACSPRAVLDVLRELLGEAGLAEPGCREDGDEPARALRDRLLELAGEACELTLASDQRPAVGAAVVAFLPHGEYAVGGHGLRLALELELPDRFDLDGVSHEPVRRFTDEDPQRRRSLLEPGGDVDDVPGRKRLPTGVAGHNLAGVHARSVGESNAPATVELLVQRLEGRLHVGGGSHGPQRVVLVDRGQAEDRHDRVADVLLDRPSVRFEHHPHLFEVAREDLAHDLRVEPVAEGRRPLEIGEDDGDELPLLARLARACEWRAAEPAEAETIGVLLTAARADDHGASVRGGSWGEPAGSPQRFVRRRGRAPALRTPGPARARPCG